MRAAATLDLLAEKFDVTVVHPELWGWRQGLFDEKWVRGIAVKYLRIPKQPDNNTLEEVARVALRHPFDGVYAFRMATAPITLRLLGALEPPSPRAAIDIDDDECARAASFIRLREASGDLRQAAFERAELARLETFEKMLLPRFDSGLLASPLDRDRFASKYRHMRFEHLPNVVRVDSGPVKTAPEPFTLLFVGTLDYLPNEDAVEFFCESILPHLRVTGIPVSVRIVGTSASPRVRASAKHIGVQIVGAVPEVAPEYERSTVVIVPLRAGGGTKIKVLEAFAYGRPVVSTAAGTAGLDLVDGEHLLIADTPGDFAAACLRLLRDAGLREKLAANALEWLRASNAIEQARRVLHALW